MQPNETLKPSQTPEAGAPSVPAKGKWYEKVKQTLAKSEAQGDDFATKKQDGVPGKEKGKEVPGWLEKLGTSVADLGRDIATANDMAMDTLDETAFKHAARGGVTMLIGGGLEKIFDGAWDHAMKTGDVSIGRTWLKFNALEMRKAVQKLKENNYPLSYFIEHTSKDILTGITYNSFAFFSNKMLPTAGSEHLLASVGINAVGALTARNPIKIEKGYAEKTNLAMQDFEYRLQRVDELEHANDDKFDRRVLLKGERKRLLELQKEIVNERGEFMNNYPFRETTDRDENIEQNSRALRENLEKLYVVTKGIKGKESQLKKRKAAKWLDQSSKQLVGLLEQKQLSPEIDKIVGGGIKTKDDIDNLREYFAKIVVDQGALSPEASLLKHKLRQALKYSNPATMLGIDWIVGGVAELYKNTIAVRKVRKEKGIVGKAVQMPKQGDWGSRGSGNQYRGKYENKGRWQGGKDKVYQGRYDWNKPAPAAIEEVDLAKFD